MAHGGHEDLDERMLHRMLFFTDAVFAIVLTLLVLELKPPESADPATGAHLVGHVGVFIMSFLLIGVFWIAHMNTTRKLARFDWLTALSNLLFLLPICLIPFASAWFGADAIGSESWAFYCWVLILTSAANMVLVTVSYRGGGQLIAGGAPPGERLYRLVRAAAPGVAFAIGLVLLAVGRQLLAHFCWAFIGVVFLAAEWLLKPRPVPRTEPA